jgi:hypothetical protein
MSEEDQQFVDSADDTSAQLCVCLSEAAAMGTDSAKSMRLLGSIYGRDILILVDSSSSHTFVSSVLAGGF